jgi:hypothetical protein
MGLMLVVWLQSPASSRARRSTWAGCWGAFQGIIDVLLRWQAGVRSCGGGVLRRGCLLCFALLARFLLV